mgnify:FL=1
MNNKGNVLIIGIVFVAIAIVIFTFVIAVFMSHINSVLYSVKLDMYSMNKSAVIAVNKNKANTDRFSYNKNAYKDEFVKLLIKNYELDDNFSNEDKLITHISIEEYEVYNKNKKDNFTKKRCDDRTIHTVLKVKVRPIILKEFLEDIFCFTIHEDVNLNMMTEY